tara:strand:+ start:332 stop:949 length:618 start_codon:yes stop_codon:yes gene_type:complete
MANITPMPNGPYIVKNSNNLTNTKGKLESKETMALCRCGHAQTKPYCDGTHGKIGFNDKKLAGATPQARREFKGKEITISDNPGVCSHAGFCDGNSPEVFYTWENKTRISNPNKGKTEKTMETIKKCPSGALAYKKDGKMHDNFHSVEEIHVSKDGPYFVRGSIKFTAEKPDSLEHYTLCRCGASKNKPFCDGQHRHSGFKDEKN